MGPASAERNDFSFFFFFPKKICRTDFTKKSNNLRSGVCVCVSVCEDVSREFVSAPWKKVSDFKKSDAPLENLQFRKKKPETNFFELKIKTLDEKRKKE